MATLADVTDTTGATSAHLHDGITGVTPHAHGAGRTAIPTLRPWLYNLAYALRRHQASGVTRLTETQLRRLCLLAIPSGTEAHVFQSRRLCRAVTRAYATEHGGMGGAYRMDALRAVVVRVAVEAGLP